MSSLINEIADYLQTASVGTVGTNIFVDKIPATPTDLIALFGAPGASIGEAREVASLHFQRFQVFVRAVDYEVGATMLEAVRTALHGKYGLALPHWRVLRCHADAEGGPIGSDNEGVSEFSINFTVESNAETSA